MASWNLNPESSEGALRAARAGGSACFVAAVLVLLWLVFRFHSVRIGAIMPLSYLFKIVQFGVLLAAGFRLRKGKGLVSGIAAAAAMVFELLFFVPGLPIGAIAIYLVVLTFLANGLHGVWVLERRQTDELAETFR